MFLLNKDSLGSVRLEMVRLSLSLVRLGLLWFFRFPCLKNYGENTDEQRKVNEKPIGQENQLGKDQQGKDRRGKSRRGKYLVEKNSRGKDRL